MRCRLRCPNQIADYRLSFGHGSGLVQHHRINLFGGFQAFGVFIRMPRSAPLPMPTMMAVGVASPRHTGEAMIKYRNQRQQSVCKTVLPIQQHPCDEGQYGNADNNRHEDARTIRSANCWTGLCCLCASCTMWMILASSVSVHFLRAEPETPFG